MFFDNQCYHHLVQTGTSENWIGAAAIIIGIAALIIALLTLYYMRYIWRKDRKIDTEIDKKIKRLLIKELQTNRGITTYLLSSIENYKKGTPMSDLRYLESKVFNSIIYSHRLVRFLSDTSIDKLFDINQTTQSINGITMKADEMRNRNIFAAASEAESWLKELLGFLNDFIPILEKEEIELQ